MEHNICRLLAWRSHSRTYSQRIYMCKRLASEDRLSIPARRTAVSQRMEPFGEGMKKQFLLSDQFTFLNHGSYGAVSRRVYEAKLEKQMLMESMPDHWFKRSYRRQYANNVEKTAAFLGALPENIVLTANVTTGVNAVLKSVKFTDKDAILVNSWTYSAVRDTVDKVAKKTGASVVSVDLRIPIRDREEIIEKFRAAITANGNIKLAVIDIIASVPPVLMPFLELCKLCHDNNILVLLDGAHSVGQIRVELEKWMTDFYVGNLHKWLYCSRGCGLLYVRADHQSYVNPLVISVHNGATDMRQRFHFQGTNDYTAFCVAGDAVHFYNDLGGLEVISCYNDQLVTEAAAMLARRWNTEVLDIPRDMEAPCMRMVRLPAMKQFPVVKEVEGDRSTLLGDMVDLTLTLMDRFRLVALTIYLQGVPYVRISANVYNSIGDYERLADAALELQQDDDADRDTRE